MEPSQVEAMVPDAVADDYEELDRITVVVIRFGLNDGIRVDRNRILEALKRLADSGLVLGYDLSPSAPPIVVKDIEWSDSIELYFYVSATGKSFLREAPTD